MTTSALFFDSIQHAMRAFQEERPDVSLELTYISTGHALEALQQRKLDVCLMRAFPGSLSGDYEKAVIENDRLMLVLPAGHPQTQVKKVPLSAIVDEKFVSIAAKQKTALYAQIMHLWERLGLKPRIAQEATTGPAVLALVAGGLGYTILPSTFQTIRFERVVWKAIEVDERWTETSLNVVCHKDTLTECVPASFIECLRQHSCAVNAVPQLD
jgi:DNA-binding transcriptional LysR family regulator